MIIAHKDQVCNCTRVENKDKDKKKSPPVYIPAKACTKLDA
jgi:hypothetical protein